MASFIVVDDSKMSREMLRSMLETLGHQVLAEASDGFEAVKMYQEYTPEFVTMDLEMPNLNGIEASEQILRANPSVKVMLITSITNKREINIAKKRGVQSFLYKPINIKDFEEEINTLLKKSHS